MNEVMTAMLAGSEGAALGAVFFGGLWWTVRRGALAANPALWFLASGLVRMGLAVAGFYLVGGGQWARLVAALGGFMVARLVVLGLTRPARQNPLRPVRELPHAP